MASPLSPHPLNTKTTIHAGEPSSGGTEGHVAAYDVGFAFIVLLFIIILIYTCYMCNRWKQRSPPPTTSDSDDSDDFHSVTLSNSLEDDIMSNFPTFVYSDAAVKPHNKVDNDIHDSGCPICLADYEAVDVLRLLPKCGHLFHMSCVDTWLKLHPTCPVCRKSPLPT